MRISHREQVGFKNFGELARARLCARQHPLTHSRAGQYVYNSKGGEGTVA